MIDNNDDERHDNGNGRVVPRAFVLATVAIVVVFIVYLTRSVLRSLRFDSNDGELTAAAATLPQNAWLVGQNEALLNLTGGDNGALLYADIVRRDDDGLIAIRPLGWYVYYVRGGKFYYLTPAFSNGSVCPTGKCAVVVLEPSVCGVVVQNSSSGVCPEDKASLTATQSLRTSCLSCTSLELVSVFAHEPPWRRTTVELDSLLEHQPQQQQQQQEQETIESQSPVTIINILNYLMDRKAL